jgi:CRISPR/Cas system-associated exonuclease Cas4 (RecB family)
LDDNKRYEIPLPNKEKIKEFEELLKQIHNFDLHTEFQQNPKKCAQCIYAELCDFYEEDKSQTPLNTLKEDYEK